MAGGDDTTTSWVLDLDVLQAISALGDFKGSLADAMNAESIEGLVGKIEHLGLVLGAIGVAAFAVKESLDLVFEGEQIEAINQQFEVLAENAGIAGDALKRGLQEASAGLIDDTTLLKEANKGIVELGVNAQKLDQIMMVARQTTAVSGGSLAANFEQLTQAIASGQTRMLRSQGLMIDQKKAYDDYAKSIGVATNELSKEGQQHAILNAVLEKSKTAFDGVNVDVKEATNTWQQFKNTMTDIKDVVAVIFEKTLGPLVRAVLHDITDAATVMKNSLVANFGEGSEKAQAKVKQLEASLVGLTKARDNLSKSAAGPMLIQQTDALNAQIAKTKAALDSAKASSAALNKSLGVDSQKATADSSRQSEIDWTQRKKNLDEFNKQYDALLAKNISAEKKTATSIAQVDAIHAQQKLAVIKQTEDEITKIKNQQGLKEAQKNVLILQTQKSSDLKLKQMDLDLQNERMTALDNYLRKSESVVDGISRAFQVGAQKNALGLKNFGKLGEQTFDSFGKHAQSAFEALGAGTESAGDAMKDMALGVVADMAESYGTMLLLTSIWPPNPLGLAAGAGLLVLAGYLKSQSGGGGSSVPSVSAGSSSNSSDYGFGTGQETPSVGSIQSPSNLNTKPQNTVSLTVEGNYYDTNEAKMAMMDMIRQATDATDFNYYKVGGQ